MDQQEVIKVQAPDSSGSWDGHHPYLTKEEQEKSETGVGRERSRSKEEGEDSKKVHTPAADKESFVQEYKDQVYQDNLTSHVGNELALNEKSRSVVSDMKSEGRSSKKSNRGTKEKISSLPLELYQRKAISKPVRGRGQIVDQKSKGYRNKKNSQSVSVSEDNHESEIKNTDSEPTKEIKDTEPIPSPPKPTPSKVEEDTSGLKEKSIYSGNEIVNIETNKQSNIIVTSNQARSPKKMEKFGFKKGKKLRKGMLLQKYIQTSRSKTKKPRKEFNLRTVMKNPNKYHHVKSIHFMSESPKRAIQNDSDIRMPFISKTEMMKNSKLEKKWKSHFSGTETHRVIQSSSGLTYNKVPLPEIWGGTEYFTKKGSLNNVRSRQANQVENQFKSLTSTEYLKKFQNQQFGKISEYGQTPNEIFASFLRSPDFTKQKRNNSLKNTKSKNVDLLLSQSKNMKKMEKRWNQRFALPISEYNEKVFKKYRLLFDKV
ncbi:unnamed protein product [Moneuplotes crassus]|uniref:Uncharacterized protein n=1 Tax=Euplotes crassus TaxID=5936 RepID=A0AAD1U8N8_EUPCR|nr:unnamed protein product [Moneuplotes crassus]